jgi:hypothetical protein
MTKQEFLLLYGKSVYQVRLEVASTLWCRREEDNSDDCLELADAFVDGLLKEDPRELGDWFT